MLEILNRCNYLYNNLKDCEDKAINTNKNNDCFKCMSNSFYYQNNDTYDCLKKLCAYTINYGSIYVSEIYHFLVQSGFLKSHVDEQRNSIKNNPLTGFDFLTPDNLIPIHLNIMSLGCGFGPDDIALNKYRENHLDWNVHFNYYGYDKEPLWNFITQTNSLPITYDLLSGMNFQGMDIVFMNKLFSTLKNHNLHTQFLNIFQQALQTLPIGCFVVFNDTNVLDLTEKSVEQGSFHPTMIFYGLEPISKYFFNVSRERNDTIKQPMNYNNSYKQIQTTTNICTIPDGLAISPMSEATQSVFFVYKKV